MWKDIVSNRLLADVIIVLFMNKTDILKAKIKAGVDVRKYVPQFEGNVKEADDVIKCKSASTSFYFSYATFLQISARSSARFTSPSLLNAGHFTVFRRHALTRRRRPSFCRLSASRLYAPTYHGPISFSRLRCSAWLGITFHAFLYSY